MNQAEFEAFVERYRDAWNSGEVDRVLALFTHDLIYVDAETRGPVTGTEAMRVYAGKMLKAMEMTYSIKAVHTFADTAGGVVHWQAIVRLPGTDRTATGEGVDLLFFRGDLVERAESYYDRVRYASLSA